MLKDVDGWDWIFILFSRLNFLQFMFIIAYWRCYSFFVVENIIFAFCAFIMVVWKWRKKQKKQTYAYVALTVLTLFYVYLDFVLRDIQIFAEEAMRRAAEYGL